MKMGRGFLWLLFAAGALGTLVIVALNFEAVTEFSPDALMFRGALYIGGVRIFANAEWSTPLLDEARDKNPKPAEGGPIKWNYVHGNNIIGRPNFSNGDAKVAYRLFRAGTWDNILSDPRNNRDEILKNLVNLMRQHKYGEAYEVLHDPRFVHN
jgi:hypothetical protein